MEPYRPEFYGQAQQVSAAGKETNWSKFCDPPRCSVTRFDIGWPCCATTGRNNSLWNPLLARKKSEAGLCRTLTSSKSARRRRALLCAPPAAIVFLPLRTASTGWKGSFSAMHARPSVLPGSLPAGCRWRPDRQRLSFVGQSLVADRDNSFQSEPCFCQFIRMCRFCGVFLPSLNSCSPTKLKRTMAVGPTTRTVGSL